MVSHVLYAFLWFSVKQKQYAQEQCKIVASWYLWSIVFIYFKWNWDMFRAGQDCCIVILLINCILYLMHFIMHCIFSMQNKFVIKKINKSAITVTVFIIFMKCTNTLLNWTKEQLLEWLNRKSLQTKFLTLEYFLELLAMYF